MNAFYSHIEVANTIFKLNYLRTPIFREMTEDHECTTHLMRHTGGKRHLTQPRGPHSVGYFDLMTPGDPKKGSLLRMYYPTGEQCLEEHERWPIWAEDKYVSGLLTFMQVIF